MKLAIISIFFLAGNVTRAESLQQWENWVVKTRSFPCFTGSPTYEGSGLLVRSGNEILVVTSEHVLIQDSGEKICHEVDHSVWGTRSAQGVKVSYVKGLATLRVKEAGGAASGLPVERLEELALEASAFRSVVAIGVPAGSVQTQVLTGGRAVQLQSRRALIPEAKQVGEFVGLPVEYGMSGGLLLGETSGGNYSFLGTLSHQILRRQGGQATAPVTLSEGSKADAADLALGLLNRDVADWMRNGESVGKAATASEKDALWKRGKGASGASELKAGPMRFQLKSLNSRYLDAGGTDANGIGGGENSGQAVGSQRVISVALASRSQAEADALLSVYPFFRKWRQELLAGKSLNIIRMSKQVSSGRYDVQAITSLDQALTLWMKDSYEPLVYIGDAANLDSALESMMKSASKLLQNLGALRVALGVKAQKGATAHWLSKMEEHIHLVSNGMVPASSLKCWLESSQTEIWDSLFQDHFDLAVALEADLRELMAR